MVLRTYLTPWLDVRDLDIDDARAALAATGDDDERGGMIGSTSFGGEVTDFFAPHAAGKRYIFVLAFGKRRRRVTAS